MIHFGKSFWCFWCDLSHPVVVVVISVILFNCDGGRRTSQLIWMQDLPATGSQSSARATDLNADGILDIVMGAGRNELQEWKQGIVAFDGRTGNLLWDQKATDQIYGTASFIDITSDGTDDVVIGGRGTNFMALDGKTGGVLWQYEPVYESDPVLKYVRFNFNSSILVPDQNNDGLADILTVNGGNSMAIPGSETDRFPSVLIVFDAKSGKILAADTMPDGKESYMTPISFTQPDEEDPTIVFGTGGETLGGHLYMTKLSSLMKKSLRDAKIIATETGHGFVATPTAADVNGDGYFDIVAISHGSTAIAIDGKDQHTIWKQTIPDTECSNSFSVGYFTDDAIPDFFTFVSQGEWPNNTGSLQILINGSTGAVDYKSTIGCTGFSSPVAYDLNDDGMDEAIISVNKFDCNKGFVTESIDEITSSVIAINFRTGTQQVIDQQQGFKNIFSTPWIGDLDSNGYLDIVYSSYFSRGGLLAFLGMRTKRVELPVRIKQKVRWGEYMGSRRDGVFDPD